MSILGLTVGPCLRARECGHGCLARALDDVAAYFQWSANLTDAGDAERLQAMRVTANYLEVVGAEVALGRGITSSDVGPASASTVVISDGLWKRRFGASTT